MGAIHSIKIQTGPTGKSGPPQKVDQFFPLDRTDPLSFEPKFPEILVEWIAPNVSLSSLLFQLFLPFFRYLYLYFWFYLSAFAILSIEGVLRDPNHAWKLDC